MILIYEMTGSDALVLFGTKAIDLGEWATEEAAPGVAPDMDTLAEWAARVAEMAALVEFMRECVALADQNEPASVVRN